MRDQLEKQSFSEPCISVVVPSYNHAQFIGTCLRSIIKQTCPPSNLLVIDDGSTDESPRVIESVLQDCPFPCELIARENRGLSATLNQGLELTSGKYFGYLSSDDVWLENFLAERLKLLRSRPAAVLAYGNTYLIDEQNSIIDCTADWADYKDGDVKEMLLQTTGPMSPTVLYVRESLARHGWNESARLEDYELYLKLCLEGEFAFDPTVLSAWRRHKGNASWNQVMMLDEHLSALRRIAPRLGLDDRALERLIKDIRFNRAEDFLRIGEKRKAAQLLLGNIAASGSPRLLRLLGRLLLPYSMESWWRQRKQDTATRRYGNLEV